MTQIDEQVSLKRKRFKRYQMLKRYFKKTPFFLLLLLPKELSFKGLNLLSERVQTSSAVKLTKKENRKQKKKPPLLAKQPRLSVKERARLNGLGRGIKGQVRPYNFHLSASI